MPRRPALDLIAALSAERRALRARPFLTPLLRGGRARLRVGGLVEEVAVVDAQPGWWRCRFRADGSAERSEEALPFERGAYLALWPALRLVLLEPLADGDWLAVPFSAVDAAQRFRLTPPVIARLVDGGQPFERVVGRVEGGTIWYDDLDRCANPLTAEALRAALAAGAAQPGVPGLAQGEQLAYALLWARTAQARQLTAAERQAQQLRQALALAGAQLIGYEVFGDEVLVTWASRDGASRPPVRLNGVGSVVSAGVCLSGRDRAFDLTSIVGVVDQAPGFARRSGGWYEDADDD